MVLRLISGLWESSCMKWFGGGLLFVNLSRSCCLSRFWSLKSDLIQNFLLLLSLLFLLCWKRIFKKDWVTVESMNSNNIISSKKSILIFYGRKNTNLTSDLRMSKRKIYYQCKKTYLTAKLKWTTHDYGKDLKLISKLLKKWYSLMSLKKTANLTKCEFLVVKFII